MYHITEVIPGEEFDSAVAIEQINANPNIKPIAKQMRIDKINSYHNPVAPPPNLEMFSNRLEQITDMRHLLHNEFGDPVAIIHIKTNYHLYHDFNPEQEALYKSDYATDGYYPHDHGLFYNESGSTDHNGFCTHRWHSVPMAIRDCLSQILYWMKFEELSGIDLKHHLKSVGLNNANEMLYDIIHTHKDELMEAYKFIAF